MDNKKRHNCVSSDISVAVAMRIIDAGAKGILFVTDEEQRLIGCVSDGDIRRWLLKTADFSASIEKCMCRTPRYLSADDSENALHFMRANSITAVPIIDSEKRIVDIIYLNESVEETPTKSVALWDTPVVIMAGGKGTRLYPYTKILPKPLIPIGDVPILERIINRFADAGAREFYISVNYKKNMIKSYFDELDRSYSIYYVDEDIPLGTGGSIRLIQKEFTSPFIVTNCDTLIDVGFGDVMTYHKMSGNAITVVAARKTTVIPYGVFKTNQNGEIISIQEKPEITNLINTGMYVVNPDLIELIPEGIMFHMPQLIESVLAKGGKVGLFPVDEDAFLDMGEFAEMKRMEEKLKSVEG